MSYNPYGSPEPSPFGAGPAGGGPAAGGPGGGGFGGSGSAPFEPGEVLQRAWQNFKGHWAPLVIAPLIAALPVLVFMAPLFVWTMLTAKSGDNAGAKAAGFVLSVVVIVVYAYFEVGLTRMWLTTARGETPDVAQLFTGFDRYPHMLTVRVLQSAPSLACSAIAAASALLGIPFVASLFDILGGMASVGMLVFLALGLYYAPFYVVDEGLDGISALRKSWEVARPYRGALLLFGILCTVIVFVASMCCCVPALVAQPVVNVAAAVVYLRITGQGAASGPGPFGSGFAGGYPGGG